MKSAGAGAGVMLQRDRRCTRPQNHAPPPPPTHNSNTLAKVRARCKLWVYPVMIATINRPPGQNKNYPEAYGIYWQS